MVGRGDDGPGRRGDRGLASHAPPVPCCFRRVRRPHRAVVAVLSVRARAVPLFDFSTTFKPGLAILEPASPLALAASPGSPTRLDSALCYGRWTMGSDRPLLTATHREVTGKAVARLRRSGQLPAVAYGHGVPSTNLLVDGHDFEKLQRHAGPNTLIDLVIDGKKPKPALIHAVQIHPVTGRPLHADFLLVRMTEELTVDVPLVPVGESPAVERLGGTLLQLVDTIKVRARPDHLPQEIALPADRLVDFDTVLHVRDLPMPAGVMVLTDPDEPVAKVAPPRLEAVPEAAEVPVEAPAEAVPEAAPARAGRGSEEGGEGSTPKVD